MDQILPLLLFIGVIVGITMLVNMFASKRNLKYVFIMPSIITVIAVIILIMTIFTMDSWAALGFFALGAIVLVAGIVGYGVSTLMYFSYKSDLKKQESMKNRTR